MSYSLPFIAEPRVKLYFNWLWSALKSQHVIICFLVTSCQLLERGISIFPGLLNSFCRVVLGMNTYRIRYNPRYVVAFSYVRLNINRFKVSFGSIMPYYPLLFFFFLYLQLRRKCPTILIFLLLSRKAIVNGR